MIKYLSKVVTAAIALLVCAPASMAQGERVVMPLVKAEAVNGRVAETGYFQPKEAGKEKDSPFVRSASRADVNGYFNRKNAPKFAPAYASGCEAFNAMVIYQPGFSGFRMCEFSAQAPALSEQLGSIDLAYGGSYGSVMGEDYYYVTDAVINVAIGKAFLKSGKVYDPATWELVKEVPLNDMSCLMYAAAYDPTTGNIYANGYKADGSGLQFGVFDPETFATSCIATVEKNYSAFACGPDGTLYAIDFDGNFGTINKANGEFTLIKETGLACDYYTTGAIAHAAKVPTFYYATLDGENSADLYSIDLATGEYAHVYTFNNMLELRGMYFEGPSCEPTAPARPSIASLEFDGQALTGTVTFDVPSKLYNGETANKADKLTYEIVANGNVIQTGSNIEYGHTYKVKTAVAEAGMYSFSVIVYNQAGPSPLSKAVAKWIGADAPAQVKNVKASWAAGKMTVAWDAVTTGAHDGAIGNVTYALYNAADSALVKDAITGTSCTIDVKEPKDFTEYQYYVVATSDGMESEAGMSNVVALGHYSAPLTTAINSDATPNWTIIDGNGDGKTWRLTPEQATYEYSNSNSGDDWLISDAILVKPGYLYTVTVSARSHTGTYPEKFEVKAGSAATAQAMTITAIEPTTVSSTQFATYSGTFVAETELTYLGIHAISDPFMWNLYVNELSINAGVNSNAPAEATDLNVIVPISGENKATLSYATPTLTVSGDELAGDKALTRVEVLLGGKVLFVDNQPIAGAVSSVEIDVPTFGQYEFQVISYNAYGAGLAAEISAYVGVNKPGEVANVKVAEVADGVVDITWDPVTTDYNGNVMNPDLITYTVATIKYSEAEGLKIDNIAEGLTDPWLKNWQAVAKGEQKFEQYLVFAVTEAGQSNGTLTKAYVLGTPYTLPYEETFANGKIQHIYDISGVGVDIFNDNSGLVSRNKDNGFAGFAVQNSPNSYSELISGKIAISKEKAELSYYYYGYEADNTNTVSTYVTVDGVKTLVDEVATSGDYEWKRRVIDMTPYAGKAVQISIRATVKSYTIGGGYSTFIDDIRLGDPIKVDVVAKSISAPTTVSTEQAFDISYTVCNQGTDEAKNVFVSLYANGNLVESSVDTLAIAAGETITGTFPQEAYSLFEAGVYAFSYVVDCEGDQDLTNNTSDVVKVGISNTNLPALQISGSEDIVKEDSTATIKLEWDTPAIDISFSHIVEGYESLSYPSFTTESFAGWTLLNTNNNPTYGVDNGQGGSIAFPGAGTAFGWILWNNDESGAGAGYDAYEGSSCMAAFSHTTGANDAWLISPAQLGVAQTVTFMARALNTSYGLETMECYYSTTGTAVADFTKVAIQGYDEKTGVTLDWTEYSIDLPAGAKYFAIRSTATDAFMLMVDNVTYLGDSPFENLELKGYDVYRNQVKITAAPVTVEEYTDVVKQNGTYDYTVVAVYNEGNSAPSNVYSVTVDFTQDGIADAVAGVKVAVEGREIVVTGAEEVTIAAVDGKLVYAGESARVAVAAGVYVVKADDTVAKVIVK